jgi:Mannosyl-glycoprotein endo-beta-N-acetylglucosaminidase
MICVVVLGWQFASYANEDTVRKFRSIAPAQLEKTVPQGFGKIFLEAARQSNLDPVFLAAVSAHESGAWKSKAARTRNNWMGLITRKGVKRFATPESSIFFAAALLNRRPFKGRSTLSSIARVYCASSPASWKKDVLRWQRKLLAAAAAGEGR